MLVGGALNNRHSAASLVPLLADTFTVVSCDRRGRGDSTNMPPYAGDREVEDLRALAAAAEGPVHLYGHSSGGILSLEAAAAGGKVRSLADSGRGSEAVEAFFRHAGAGFDPGMTRAPWWPALVSLAYTLPYDLALSADGGVPADRFAGIAAPVLALHGGASASWAAASATAVAAAVQDGRKNVIGGQVHAVAPDAVAPVLLEFFR
ncbi:alpha/beta hydrolase [Pseudarthrobacter sp. AL07]|uniref:alpha/beta fold hydrolase n=1 Tax=Pseudarthrobacter sp. AL20 TaxID=3042239 RepID=UPI00249AEC75|nr:MULTISPECIES: alpha/beta hydrolase [unclassified Pseudarthrobacter]MDI3195859.1 alpha/beta hydrolase [Pseudarthrobacter sp. AL20]MDI3209598.1 alpha/beta hydrolase [Pseudarthrobacter sp. AL07]